MGWLSSKLTDDPAHLIGFAIIALTIVGFGLSLMPSSSIVLHVLSRLTRLIGRRFGNRRVKRRANADFEIEDRVEWGIDRDGRKPRGSDPSEQPALRQTYGRGGLPTPTAQDLEILFQLDNPNTPPTSVEPDVERPTKDGATIRISYATNRALNDPNTVKSGFSSKRAAVVSYGSCDVYVPKSHRIGSIGSSALRRLFSGTDDRLKLVRISTLEEAFFWSSLNTRIAQGGGKHVVVFLHGYNVSFEQAAIRSAQIAVDLGIAAMAMFSWPSKGEVKGYPSDEASIEASTGAITDFLVALATRSAATEVHIIAHSMGNRGLLRAMERIGLDAERRSTTRFSQIILAAPDVDAHSFREMAAAYTEVAKRTTLYVSERDKAVELSGWLHDYPRIGFYPPVSVFSGIDTVSVSGIDVSVLGHGYVGEAREVLTDMHQLIFSGLPPQERFSIRSTTTSDGKPYWVVKS